jgi:hypothetical protein
MSLACAKLTRAARNARRLACDNAYDDAHEHPTEWPDEISVEPSMPHPGIDPVEVTTEPRAEHPKRMRSNRERSRAKRGMR